MENVGLEIIDTTPQLVGFTPTTSHMTSITSFSARSSRMWKPLSIVTCELKGQGT